ncbi:MAG: hypothetical protein ABJO28_08755 [Maribacter dokdonensis]|uniref:hypothetical protein n=1 Tax=Maribacter dokdonensis TaxID=320912 RepID=UPI00329843E8
MAKNHVIKTYEIFDYNKCSNGQLEEQKNTMFSLLRNLGLDIPKNNISKVNSIIQELNEINNILLRREGFR